jgi:nucleotide-binding universal stress UspA family protein
MATSKAYIRVAESLERTTLPRFFMAEPPLYKTIAVASTFSPRFVQVLAEAKRIRDRFGSELSAIYVGECNEETTKKFRDAFAQVKLPNDSRVHYQRVEDPAAGILQAIAENRIDLVVAGALEKEVVLRPFLGNVARRLVREAKCSVMLFTKPEAEPQPLRRIVFMADYSDHAQHALQLTLRLAEAEDCERLYVIRVYTTFDEARAAMQTENNNGAPRARTFEEEEKALEEFILAAGQTSVPIEARCVRGNTGFAASDFVQSVDADLLVVPIHPNEDPQEPLPNHIAWITDVIPCNLWVIR